MRPQWIGARLFVAAALVGRDAPFYRPALRALAPVSCRGCRTRFFRFSKEETMPFTLIRGAFAPSLGTPDGDSLRFVPDDPDPLFRLRRRGRPPRINRNNGSIQLRYEAIDTMESQALMPFSSDATASNLALAGVGDGTPGRGHIFSTQIDPYGRPIAFVFAGDTDHADGSDVFLGPDDIMASINVQQLARGHAYPLFYDTLFDDLRQRCTAVSLQATAERLGVWSADRTNTGATWTGAMATLPPIFPKLWRRIRDYLGDETFFDPARPMAGLTDWIEQERPERVSVPNRNLFTGFDDIIEVTDTTVRMTVQPHELVIISAT